MKGIIRKILSVICVLTMVMNCFVGFEDKCHTVHAESGKYTELTLSDFGMADQSFAGSTTGVSGKVSSGISTLDKTIISGKITLSSHVDEHLMIGGADDTASYYSKNAGIIISQAGNGQMVVKSRHDEKDGTPHYLFEEQNAILKGGAITNGTITFQVQLDYEGNNVKVTLTLNDGTNTITDSATLEGIADKMTTNLAFNPWVSNCNIASIKQEVKYTELTFSDFGMADQSFTGSTTGVSGKVSSGISTLDKTVISGKITLSSHVDEHLMIGGADDTASYYSKNAGIIISQAGNGQMVVKSRHDEKDGTPHYLFEEQNAILKGGAITNGTITFQVQLDYEGNNVKVTLTLDDGTNTITDSATLEGIADKMTTNFAFNPWVSNCSIASIEQEDIPDPEETEITFSDCDIEDATFNAANSFSKSGTMPDSVTSLKNVTFKGVMAFTTWNDPYIMLGGEAEELSDETQTSGIVLIKQPYYDDGELKWGIGLRCNIYDTTYQKKDTVLYTEADMKAEGIEFTGQPWLISMTITYTGTDKQDVTVAVKISNGVHTLTGKEHTFTGVRKYLKTTKVVVDAKGSAGSIASVKKVKETSESYNLSSGAYLMDMAGCITAKDGILTEAGSSLNHAGNYTLMGVEKGIVKIEKIALYALGDMDLDATVDDNKNVINNISVKDLVILKKCIADASKYTQAHLCAADLSNDNKVDEDDAEMMRQVLAGIIRANEYYPATLTYEFIGGDEVMPIGGYEGPYAKDGKDYLTDDIYKALSDANINLIVKSTMDYLDGNYDGTTYTGVSATEKALQLSEKYKIGMYVADSNINYVSPTGLESTNTELGVGYDTKYKTFVHEKWIENEKEAAQALSKYSIYDSCLGTYVKDEPFTATFNATNASLLDSGNRLEWYTDAAKILNRFSNTFGYLNAQCYSGRNKDNPSKNILSGIDYNYKENTSVALYKEYLNEILTDTQIPVLAYDNYMYAAKGSISDEKRSAKDANTWIVNLDTVRSVAKKNDTGKEVPFWTYVAAGGYFDDNTTAITGTDQIMTQRQFDWQVNVPLAFGTKGLTYFPLIQPTNFATDEDADGKKTRNGMINTESQTTVWYDYAKVINRQVAAVDHVLMKADNKGVIVSEGTDSYAYKNMVNISYKQYGTSPTRPYSVQNYTLEAYKSSDPQERVIKFTSDNTEYGAIAGVFSYLGQSAYYVVNWNDEGTSTDTVTLMFDKNRSYTLIQEAKETTVSGTECKLQLAAGEGALIILSN